MPYDPFRTGSAALQCLQRSRCASKMQCARHPSYLVVKVHPHTTGMGSPHTHYRLPHTTDYPTHYRLPHTTTHYRLPHTLPAWVLAHVVIISADPRLRDCHYKKTID